ncbi:hypothetical protein LEP1GSC036_3915 [Leptospira weilii str. 2006001853]|uniref:Uncharacterized protein n=1 Tax=Leptospira weilii str. 2006001853 TaxID=1001589 RepID=A0A828Z4S4_9LEPT|nr:hypothetical protein [Leptospira weilii]EKR66354.1 hypothetical protein LEP1GSC036_3915 [Leptospira weilii str. 2006001853]ULH28795.1 hypothetical protein FH586_02245 [Leptospira weilii]UPY80760.1 hypothetical protein FH581_022005 [Leptospira weilii]
MLDNLDTEMVLQKIEETLDILTHNILLGDSVPKDMLIRSAAEEILDIVQVL